MMFQKTTEHAIRVLIYLAQHPGERLSTLRLHRDLGIPYKYLGRLMHKLAGSGLLEVRQGKTGGYMLASSSESIYLKDIVEVVEGIDKFSQCIMGFPSCSSEHPCSLHERWLPQQKELVKMLEETSLEQLKNEGFVNA